MRKLIIAGLMAAVAVPTAANAQWYDNDVRDERRDLREEQNEYNQARRYGDRDDIRDERRDVRDARQDYREEVREERRDDRRYQAGRYSAPRGYAWRQANRGHRLNRAFYGSNYYIARPGNYGLYAPRYSHARWVRHGRDVLLVDIRSGLVIDVRRNRFY